MTNKQYYIVTDGPGFLKDPESKAIVQSDASKKAEHTKRKLAIKSALVSSSKNEQRIAQLEDRLNSIESLLRQLLEKQ